ncbi:hypothetical protein HZY62_08310 [Maribacter polysiphoniae]|uniref:Methylamine utilisation protein MauE domain-containing protein n=1 Tax=Maribacter polysiphoniae TaxID=429344 RepID=A0A316E408_9FLAO|nr:MauE/DoxX family redox-associated membrane protein [Maribacter polysiphoniae]MBD1260589.1 hypothetical protein [Maribacter polysiphoniae]PWK24282.1 hypothetical protein LX92_01872 [Maribacter polysiphoniae]
MIHIEKIKQTIACSISMVLATLFLFAATTKLLNYREFSLQLAQPSILRGYTDIVAWMVPVAELVVSVLLFFKTFRLQALFASFGLIVLFTTYILLILNFSDVVPCSCVGVIPALGWTDHILFNIALLALAALGIFYSKNMASE